MKKTLLSAAAFAVVAVSAVSIAPTTSEAIPAFARQTGAACLSCHFQSFPTLSSFGRSFKEGAFTDVGEQALIEDDDLSIPSSLNITAMFRPQFNYTKNTGLVPTAGAKSIAATADQVLMIAGRIGENTGAFVEVGFGAGGGFGNNQLLHSVDMGDGKVILSYFNTGFGEDAGLQLMSVWGQHGGLLNGKNLSINNSMATIDAAGNPFNTVGVSVAYANEMGAISLGGINNDAAVGTNWSLAPVVRAQGFFDLAGAELGVGGIYVNGKTSPVVVGLNSTAKRFGIDAQVQGELGDTQYGIYADYASAKASTATQANVYNPSLLNSRTGYSIRATVKPLHNVILMVGAGQDKVGIAKQNKIATGIEYELYQNAVINLTYDTSKLAGTKTTNYGLDFEFLM